MSDLLNTIYTLGNGETKSGNLTLEIKVDDSSTTFDWEHNFNGCDYKEIALVFKNENSYFIFSDEDSRHKMGNTDVNVSEEQAIEIAVDFVKNYSYVARRGPEGNTTEVSIGNFNISRERTGAELARGDRDHLFYPIWRVNVALGSNHPTNVYAIGVNIWADTGVIANTALQSVGGVLPPNPSDGIPDASFMIGVAVPLLSIALVAVVTVAYKKKRKK